MSKGKTEKQLEKEKYSRIDSDPQTIFSSKALKLSRTAKALKIWAIVLVALAVLGFIGSINSDDIGNGIFGLVFFGGLGIFLYKKYNEKNVSNVLLTKYKSIIDNNIWYLDEISDTTSTTVDNVINELQHLIDKGYIINSHIDVSERRLITPGTTSPGHLNDASSIYVQVVQNTPLKPTPSSSKRTVKCPNCGAMNTINIFSNNKCEYCGTPISADD